MIMLHRRQVLIGGLGAGLVLALGCPAALALDPGRAAAFVQQTGQQLVGVLNDPRLDTATRRQRVAQVLRQSVDIDGVGRFILGRWWPMATPAEQQEYLRLFQETLIRNLSARFGDYQGVRFQVGRSQPLTEDDALVSTVIERPNSQPFALDWRISQVGGQPRIVDVIAEGTSLRLTTRSEYSSVIQQNGGRVSALLDAMRNQIQRLAAQERS
ncbi:MAG TPA: ABC transporter substrate-binding protein [Crenalkalicoccus sp.]|jgi:phospholipid transport system substrate-binding protein|nr:ABC transporter substrate-binding protein [Crenalkalicoccus sp.]